MSDEMKSWSIKEEAVLEDLTVLMGVTAEEGQALAARQDQAKNEVPKLIEAFYGRLLGHEPTAEYFAAEGKVEHVKKQLSQWFVEIFSGNYDQAYVKSRLQIGKTHVHIGLPVRYPLAMMDVMLEHGRSVTGDDETTYAAFTKLLALDIAIFNQAYEDTQLQHLADMVGNERLARRLLTQEAAI